MVVNQGWVPPKIEDKGPHGLQENWSTLFFSTLFLFYLISYFIFWSTLLSDWGLPYLPSLRYLFYLIFLWSLRYLFYVNSHPHPAIMSLLSLFLLTKFSCC